jgi:CBS domain containing-hemolysin-like protein
VLKILAVFALVLLNGFFVAAEFALVSHPRLVERLLDGGWPWSASGNWPRRAKGNGAAHRGAH